MPSKRWQLRAEIRTGRTGNSAPENKGRESWKGYSRGGARSGCSALGSEGDGEAGPQQPSAIVTRFDGSRISRW